MKKFSYIVAVFIIILNTIVYANSDVNIGSSDPFWAGNYASEIERVSTRCARISLWEIESGRNIDVKNICEYKQSNKSRYSKKC